MAVPITAIYVPEDDDWAVTVTGQGKSLTARAPGIIAARDRVDQFVEELGAEAKGATVVHLLNGSALEFTAAYMTARLSRPEPAPIEVPEPAAPAEGAATAEAPAEVPEQPAPKPDKKPKAKLTANIGDALTTAKPAAPQPAAASAIKVTAAASTPAARA
ncbi:MULTISPECIES: hypothetical protein [Amycolatopsis]|uniref:DUF2188 domain-containing protein n=1 Tax=Amycolatopsis thermalba TaxID=944492 RepID=A0ABY4P3M1_9PSEU|nr:MULTISPECIES: hypothetical protein [Amycolatopsis]OXM71365.1 hypothetical protein CF166_18995 [Amycolatopsis sp. KNN50.9b]UQS26955.1 hypothetical protein L1857_31225 [Amycolatopsis thermalba]